MTHVKCRSRLNVERRGRFLFEITKRNSIQLKQKSCDLSMVGNVERLTNNTVSSFDNLVVSNLIKRSIERLL